MKYFFIAVFFLIGFIGADAFWKSRKNLPTPPASYKVDARSGQWEIEHRRIADAGYGRVELYYSKQPPIASGGIIHFVEEGSGRSVRLSGDIRVTQVP